MPQAAPTTDAAEVIDATSPNDAAGASQSLSPTAGSLPSAASRTRNPDDLGNSRNWLLRGLDPGELQRLSPHCEPVWLAAGEALGHVGGPLSHVYCPVTAAIALVARADEVAGLQVALVGREGIFASPAAEWPPVSPLNAVVRASGWTWRVGADAFLVELGRSPRLRAMVDRYFHELLVEASRISACTRFHALEARLARWLLTLADRLGCSAYPLRVQAMAEMLGAPRSGAAQATAELRQHGLIRYSRGSVAIIDAGALEQSACSCYRRPGR